MVRPGSSVEPAGERPVQGGAGTTGRRRQPSGREAGGRSATDALKTLRIKGARGGNHVLDADIRDYSGSIDNELLMERIRRRISDRRVLRLIRLWLQAGVMEDGEVERSLAGTPQGGVISPLLSSIYLHYLDRVWERQCSPRGVLVRYADDFVVMCETAAACEEAERRVKTILGLLRLELHPDKTGRVELTDGKDGFDFPGCHLHTRVSGRLLEQGRWVFCLIRETTGWKAEKHCSSVLLTDNGVTGSSLFRHRGASGRDVCLPGAFRALVGTGLPPLGATQAHRMSLVHIRFSSSGRLPDDPVLFLHCWPRPRAMKRVRQRVHELTDRRWHGVRDTRDVIRRINPVLRGWGNYFRTGNAADTFIQVDRYVVDRLWSLQIKRRGRNLHAGQARQWTREWFEGHGLCRLRGTIRYPGAA